MSWATLRDKVKTRPQPMLAVIKARTNPVGPIIIAVMELPLNEIAEWFHHNHVYTKLSNLFRSTD